MKRGEIILIDNIRLDGATQPRAALDFEAIEDYADAMGAGAKFPPVTVFYDGEHYWLADGFHRVKAAYAAGLDTIECEVRQGTLEDAQWFSFSANKANGLRRSNDDKQRAIKAALAHPRGAGLSDSEIARHCGVTQPTVAAWREKLGLSSKILKIQRRTVTRKGKTFEQNTANIGRRTGQPAPVGAGQLLDTFIRAVLVISNGEASVKDLVRQLASRTDRDQLISSMEKANDFLTLCAAEARRAEGCGSPTGSAGDHAVATFADAGDAGTGQPVA